MSNTSASKTRSLTMTLMMVLMALSPMASVEADHDENWFGDYELHVDGTLYDEVGSWPSEVDILSCTRTFGTIDGTARSTSMATGVTTTRRILGLRSRLRGSFDGRGNAGMEYYVSGLDPDTNYTANIYVYVYDFNTH